MPNTAKLYNPGLKIEEMMRFNNDPEVAARQNTFVSFWQLTAPEGSFFEVPREMTGGTGRVAVFFAEDILARYAERGVILVDKNREHIEEQEPVANSEEEAVRKGNTIWRAYLEDAAKKYLSFHEEVKREGGKTIEATGFVKYALKKLGVDDPGARVVKAANDNSDRLAQLEKEIKELLAANQKIDPPEAAAGKRK